MDNQFSHVDDLGQPTMVDVSNKKITKRIAKAQCKIFIPAEVLSALNNDNIATKKGAVFQTAIIAGIMAAKKTGDLIPLCHPIGLDDCSINIAFNNEQNIIIESTATINSKTGVEMEAMMAVSVAALTVYDMCKAISHDIVIGDIQLIEKSGGKRDFKRKLV